MNKWEKLAEKALRREPLSRQECAEALACPDAETLSLLDAAFRVRRHFCGLSVQVQVLTNAKSGLCSEDCRYCSQSSISDAPIEQYALLSGDALVEEALRAKRLNARRYCMALSGRGPTDREIDRLCEVVGEIKKRADLEICCSLGLLSTDQAKRLKTAGLDRVNHNLNTSRRYHEAICTTHSYDDRLATLHTCRQAGLELCSGAIFGQGESDSDIIDLCEAWMELRPEAIPVNFLVPIDGTPFASLTKTLTPLRCLRILSLVRLTNPDREIRVAGGREHHLRSLQPLALYSANSIFITGYLTTPGQRGDDAWAMIADLGFSIEFEEEPPEEFRQALEQDHHGLGVTRSAEIATPNEKG